MEYVMELIDVTKRYNGIVVVNSFQLKMEKGHIYGLIGPNGSGKTTIMKMIAGLLRPDSGRIKIFGDTNLSMARKRCGFLMDVPFLDPDLTVIENMEYLRRLRGVAEQEYVTELLDKVGLPELAYTTLSEFTHTTKVKKLSLGMRQRLGIAMTLLAKPEILILDEPVNGMDPDGIYEIRELLKYLVKMEEITILISSHLLKELSELCTDYVFINKGEVIEQISAEELAGKSGKYLKLNTTDLSKTITILEENLGISNYKVDQDGKLYLYEGFQNVERISKEITDHNVLITELMMGEEPLEEYYFRKVGRWKDERLLRSK